MYHPGITCKAEFALMRGRELKFLAVYFLSQSRSFALMRGRELKLHGADHHAVPAAVRPHARAGVEIQSVRREKEEEAFALMRGRELKYVAVSFLVHASSSPSCEGGS